MSTNATWWVRYRDTAHPHMGMQLLSLSSPDMRDPKAAARRAAGAARARLKKKGCKPVILSVQCVG